MTGVFIRREKEADTEREKPYEVAGRDWSDVPTS